MDEGREESCTGASSYSTDSDDSPIHCDLFYKKEMNGESQRCPSASSLLRRRLSFLSSIIVFLALGGGGIRNQGVKLAAGAGITLPVSRSFSKMEGSGTAEGESGGMTLEHHQQLRDHDQKRALLHHGRVLAGTTVVDFPLGGNDYAVGLYYTEIGLGTPSSQYFLQVDTGSELMWVNCKPCKTCPSSSDLQIPLRLYDPISSRTASNSSCNSDACSSSVEIGGGSCVDNSCQYSLSYGDGSTGNGYLVEDTITYDTGNDSNHTMSTASATVVLGCGFDQTGDSLTSSSAATDGIMGFGQSALSVVTQLANLGKTTNMFAHCLQGDTGEGGTFVIGDVQEPGIVYTDLVAEQVHYNVVLQSMSLGGTDLGIPPSAFGISDPDSGTILDSGTTLALLVDEGYNAFLQQGSTSLWCFGWSKSSDSGLVGLTILGDIVLKNKLVIYDLKNSRIGWVNYNCKSSINVSNGTAQEVLYPQGFKSGSDTRQPYHPIAGVIYTAVLIYVAAFL